MAKRPGPDERGLVVLAPGVAAWLGDGPFGRPNAGVIVEHDGLTLVDTLLAPRQAAPLVAALDDLGRPVRRVALSSAHIPFVGGSSCFVAAAFYGTPTTSDLLDLPPFLAGYRRLLPDDAVLFDDELTTRPVSHTVERDALLTDAVVARVTAGESTENLMIEVPGAGVLFAGAMASFGTTPLAFDGDPAAWATALRGLAADHDMVVPGHGPVGGAEELLVQADYLDACVTGRIPAGPWDRWTHRHFDAVNIERAALLADGDHRPPPSMLALLGLG